MNYYSELLENLKEGIKDLKIGSKQWMVQTGLIAKSKRVQDFCERYHGNQDYQDIVSIIIEEDGRQQAISNARFELFREIGEGSVDGDTLAIVMKAWREAEEGDDLYDDYREAWDEARKDQATRLESFNEGAVKFCMACIFAVKALDTEDRKTDNGDKPEFVSFGTAALSLLALAQSA